MDIQENVALRDHSTMRLGGSARYAVDITDRFQVDKAASWAKERSLPLLMIGSGSNIVWRDEGFPGLLLINKIPGYQEFAEDNINVYLTLGAGENWDSVVDRTVQEGLSGIEALSLIPGTTGATPVQNVGAYGQEISDTLVSVEAYDTQQNQLVNIPAAECDFGYRTSRFKTTDRGRFLITGITLHLVRQNPMPPFYRAVEEYLAAHNPKAAYSMQDIRDAVIAIRSSKLPDPAKVANNGSFFANPIISQGQLVQLQATYPDIPHWATKDPARVKIPAAWLIEKSGFKDIHDTATGMATWHYQPLVLVNERAGSTADLLAFKQSIVAAIHKNFGIELVQEPELLP
jgi:UDP-N-acetylmuramate dehydrogenase